MATLDSFQSSNFNDNNTNSSNGNNNSEGWASHENQQQGVGSASSSQYAILVRMGYRNLRFDVPIVVDEDNVMEIIRRKMGAPPAAKEAIEALPVCEYDDLGPNEEDHLCVICQDQFTTNDNIMSMPCRHVFHNDCLKRWLELHNTCPTCRLPIEQEKDAKRKRLQSELERTGQSDDSLTTTPSTTLEDGDTDEDNYVIMLSDAEIREMRQHVPVRELKVLIRQAGGDCGGCVEKEDLFMRYLSCLDRQCTERQQARQQQRRNTS